MKSTTKDSIKVIVYSLFGEDPKYLKGALINAEQVKEFYPEWRTVFYVDQPESETARGLKDRGVIVIDCSKWKMGGLYWRHCFPYQDYADSLIYLVRDCDSRITRREVDAVNAWMASGKNYHIMRDHPKHTMEMMQGLYGARGTDLACFNRLLADCPNERNGAVEVFAKVYHEIVKHDVLEHGEFNLDRYPNQVPFPTPRESDYQFCGEIWDENNQRNEDWKALVK